MCVRVELFLPPMLLFELPFQRRIYHLLTCIHDANNAQLLSVNPLKEIFENILN